MDHYEEFLLIPAPMRPPTHYQLFGIDDFESDQQLIEKSAKERTAHLHQIAAGPQRKIVQKLLNEIAVARRTLLSTEAKAAYDEQLLADRHAVHDLEKLSLIHISEPTRPY